MPTQRLSAGESLPFSAPSFPMPRYNPPRLRPNVSHNPCSRKTVGQVSKLNTKSRLPILLCTRPFSNPPRSSRYAQAESQGFHQDGNPPKAEAIRASVFVRWFRSEDLWLSATCLTWYVADGKWDILRTDQNPEQGGYVFSAAGKPGRVRWEGGAVCILLNCTMSSL